jgi:hypothetical protein
MRYTSYLRMSEASRRRIKSSVTAEYLDPLFHGHMAVARDEFIVVFGQDWTCQLLERSRKRLQEAFVVEGECQKRRSRYARNRYLNERGIMLLCLR